MYKLTIPKGEWFDEKTQEFITVDHPVTIALEHSLVSLSKWESKWKKPYLSFDQKTKEEQIDYIRCMTLTQNVDPKIYYCIPPTEIMKINEYINDPMTATTFGQTEKKGGREIITSEIIYYWMTCYNIPFECQKWHLGRLIALIRVCAAKNTPQKQMSAKEIMNRNRALNKARRAQLHTKG